MKTIISAVASAILFCSISFAQTYDLRDYTNGTETVEGLKSRCTAIQINRMLENAEMCRNNDKKHILGIRMQDPNTLENIVISDTDSTLILFEYIKKLRFEIANLKQRLQSAEIP